MSTLKELKIRYGKDYAWRRAWAALANGERGFAKWKLSTQLEYISNRACLADTRIRNVMQKYDRRIFNEKS